jgi:hypothetical protein
MKKILLICLTVMLAGPLFSQKFIINKFTGRKDAISGPIVEKLITAANVNGGDSVIIAVADSNGIEYESIAFTKSAGTNFTAAGTDTVAYVYVNCGGKKNAIGKISGKWIIGTYLTGRLLLIGCMDSGSPIWIKFGADFATGTRTLTTKTKGR